MSIKYSELREEIVKRNENLIGTILDDKENRLNQKLEKMKEEFKETCEGNIPFDMPVLTDERIWNSELYKFCKRLPKGSDLHVHGSSLIPAHKLIDFVLKEENLLIDIDTCILHLRSDEGNFVTLKEAFSNGLLDRKTLIKKWTVLDGLDSIDMWQFFENIFRYHEAIDRDFNILKNYYVFAFNDYVNCNIDHVEIHVLLSGDLNETLNIINTIKDAYLVVKKDHPDFVVNCIGSSMKMIDYSIAETESIFANTLYAHENIKDDGFNFVLGFDLINEEDKSRPLKDYAEKLIELKENHPDFEYFLHSGESLDPNNDNLIDAYLLKATRVGHGTNLYRYPELLKRYADEEICLESCLISNQVLRYTRDIRLHPSAEYLKRGITLSLCSDDPAYMEHEQLSDDFFAAIVSWDLGIAEIKQFAINSIMYSGLEQERKTKLLKSFRLKWDKFVEDEINVNIL